MASSDDVPKGRFFCKKNPSGTYLLVEGGAELTLKKNASLIILGETGRYDGLTLLGNIRNDGKLECCRQKLNTAMLERIKGGGILAMPDSCNISGTARK
jgi:hypothetical protein